jgi:hypothetical protein
MNVGILTYHSSYNFGANLQTLATQSALEKKGITPFVIDYRDEKKMEVFRHSTLPGQAEAHEQFIKRHLRLSPRFTRPEEVEQFCLDSLDAVLVGSDAVFRLTPKYEATRWIRHLIAKTPLSTFGGISDQLPPYWLNWPNKSSGKYLFKASIAASATGTKFYLLKCSLYRDLWRAINDFGYMTVRDRWTRAMIICLSLGNKVPSICPDPVITLSDNFSIPAAEKAATDVSKTILLSARFPRSWILRLAEEAHKRGFRIASMPNPGSTFEDACLDSGIKLPLSPLTWYDLLANCAGFLGIRFHALVSCIANVRPVIAMDTVKRHDLIYRFRSRVADLCHRAEIMNRYSTERNIAKSNAIEVLDNLFDEPSLQRMKTYTMHAKKDFDGILNIILNEAAASNSRSSYFF